MGDDTALTDKGVDMGVRARGQNGVLTLGAPTRAPIEGALVRGALKKGAAMGAANKGVSMGAATGAA